MRLSRSNRVLLVLFGALVFGVGILGTVIEWPWGTPITLVVLGVLIVIAGILGVLPNGNLREMEMRWPDPALYDRVEQLEKDLPTLRNELASKEKQLRGETSAVGQRLDDYLLSLEPEPVDEYETAEERVADWEQAYADLDTEISWRRMNGVHPAERNDDLNEAEAIAMRDQLHARLTRERRRLDARTRFAHLKRG
ncbi:hypothetical protein [Micromonospora sp. NBC_00858]|uniref:hypothetical protein n=1 Tax=Micromonospora sp. NBC_00858 TaxID=2975979 RepID=UPI003865D1BB|nr:tetraspanin family protein [Micromonospora sp. NBC_00858]